MVPLAAEILTEKLNCDERAAVRRSLRLGVSAYSTDHVTMALILNLSETGLLIETVLELAVGETLQVDIPEVSASTVRVVWTEGLLAGCEFVDAVSTGAVSAARLMSPIEAPDVGYDSPPTVADTSAEEGAQDAVESSAEGVIIIIISLISVLALLIFLAALLTAI